MRALLLALGISSLLALALPARAEAPQAPHILAVKFHADWCGSCKQMGSVFEDLRNWFDGRPVLFVVLDRTNVTTSHQAELMAGALGIAPVYAENSGTGFILLLDGRTREVRGKLGASLTLKQMTAQLEGALAARDS